MKKGVSICFFVAVLLILLLFLIFWEREDENPRAEPEIVTEERVVGKTEEETEMLTESMRVVENEKYYLKEADGYLAVYHTKNDEIYCETNIRFELLSPEMQAKIKEGVSFETEAELYDFLESYSS